MVPEEGHESLHAVVQLVVPESDRVKVEEVVKSCHHPPLEVRIPDCALVEISCIDPEEVLGLGSQLLHCCL